MDDFKQNGDDQPDEGRPEYGYKKPPRNRQFRKGQSGNPSGRPKQNISFKSVDRMLRDCLLQEVEGFVNGKRRKMSRLEAIISRQISDALQGDLQATKFLLALAAKYVPHHLSLAELMEGRPVFEFTKEEEARFTKEKLLDGVVPPPDEQPVL